MRCYLVGSLWIGYVCFCGERVVVAQFRTGEGQENAFPSRITVSCRNGHVATITPDQLAVLEHWNTEDQAP